MSAALEEITERALTLSRQERLALANRLLSEDHDGDVSAVETAWEDEILARIQAIDDGTAVGIPYEDVIRAARNRRAAGASPAFLT
jgi:putative addiction module component (TIGR02574 family)